MRCGQQCSLRTAGVKWGSLCPPPNPPPPNPRHSLNSLLSPSLSHPPHPRGSKMVAVGESTHSVWSCSLALPLRSFWRSSTWFCSSSFLREVKKPKKKIIKAQCHLDNVSFRLYKPLLWASQSLSPVLPSPRSADQLQHSSLSTDLKMVDHNHKNYY